MAGLQTSLAVPSAAIAFTLFTTLVPQVRADFLPLDDLIDGSFYSRAYSVSGDGSVVVGFGHGASGYEAFRWTEEDGMVGLGDLVGGSFNSRAYGANSDGSVVVGRGRSASGTEAFRWTEAGGMVGLGDLAGGGFYSQANGVSNDGSVVVGQGSSASGLEAFRWSEAGGMVGLGDLAGGSFESMAYGANSDGAVVVGYGTSASGKEAFRWTEAGGMVGLGDLPGGFFGSWALSVNSVGNVVVGFSNSVNGMEAFRWTEPGGMVGLGDLVGGSFDSIANDVSGDGSVVVGYGTSASGKEAFRWTDASGMQTVTDWLTDAGVSVGGGFILTEAQGVSGDGNVVVGYGTNGGGNTEAWIARGESGVLFLDGDLKQSLASSGLGLEQVTQSVDLMLNGAHHRPLMDSVMPGKRNCAWVSGDLAHYGRDRDGDSALGEVGWCYRVQHGLMFGIGLGRIRSDEETTFSGNSEVDGKYLLAEVDYRPDTSSSLYSLTTVIGRWDTDIRRGYMNGAVEDSSSGRPDIDSVALRARIDWLDIWQLGGSTFTPYIQFALIHTSMDGYTETGGGFPVRFNKRDHTARELRMGMSGEHLLSETTTLRGNVEAVHRFDQSSAATSGQVIGLFGFDLPGIDHKQNWMRVGLELDHSLSRSKTLSLSMHVSSAGEDPSYSAGVSLKVGFD
jgi:probable HAF family extracellular repeat protein